MTTSAEEPGTGPVLSFPRQQARTRRFSLGVPRNFTVSPDGHRVVFLRSPAGDDPATSLWVYDVPSGSEREVAGARQTLGGDKEDLPDEERARRERSRELAGGITAYACDEAVRHAAFALSGRLWWVNLEPGFANARFANGGPVELPAPSAVVDPRPDPTGQSVAFLSGPALHMVSTAGDQPHFVIAEEQGPELRATSPGAPPSSSQRKRWAGGAVSGGHPTGVPYWPPELTTAPWPPGGRRIRRSQPIHHARTATLPPAPRTRS